MSTKKDKYSQAQRNAYLRGQGYEQAKAGKRVECKTEEERKSFSKGRSSAKKWRNSK